MDVYQLRRTVDRAGRGGEFAFSDVPRAASDGLGNGVTVVEPADLSGRWTTYFTERGAIIDQRFFDSEAEVCEFVLAQLDHEVRSAAAAPRVVATDEAREHSRAIAAEEDRRFRAILVARGLDPVTGRPVPPEPPASP